MTGSSHASSWIEAAARHLIEESIIGCSSVIATFVGASGKPVGIVIERSPVRIPRGAFSVINDGVWIHSDDSSTAAGGSALKFEAVSAIGERSSTVTLLNDFLHKELEGQEPFDLHMEGIGRDGEARFSITMYSDDGISFTTGATTRVAQEPAECSF